MEAILSMWPYVIPFLVVITILVFVHELGHYLLARINGIKVEVFSIGFGPELLGWTDKVGTRWKISMVPLGGYVRMYGDQDESSRPGGALKKMTPEEKSLTLHGKTVWQRIAVSFSGPLFNYLFAILLLIALFATIGQKYIPADIASVAVESPAAKSGLKAGDLVKKINGQTVENFLQLQEIARNHPNIPLEFVIERQGQILTLGVTPEAKELKDNLGRIRKVGVLGISHSTQVEYKKMTVAQAISQAISEVFTMSASMLEGLWQIIIGAKSTDELGGILRIAKISGEVAQSGWANLLWLTAFLSINLGLINLLPIPVLDGGHIFFYLIEAIRGKPLSDKAQEYGFRIGFVIIIGLMILSFWNDLMHLGVFKWFRDFL